MERGDIVRGIGLGVVAMLTVVAVGAVWVLVYSLTFAPGHDGAHYQAEGQRVAPFVSIIAGIPMLFAAGWLMALRTKLAGAALLPAITYVALDLALSAAGNVWPPVWALALSWLTKAAAAWAGGWLAMRRPALRRIEG